jgi:hypothetical protein
MPRGALKQARKSIADINWRDAKGGQCVHSLPGQYVVSIKGSMYPQSGRLPDAPRPLLLTYPGKQLQVPRPKLHRPRLLHVASSVVPARNCVTVGVFNVPVVDRTRIIGTLPLLPVNVIDVVVPPSVHSDAAVIDTTTPSIVRSAWRCERVSERVIRIL